LLFIVTVLKFLTSLGFSRALKMADIVIASRDKHNNLSHQTDRRVRVRAVRLGISKEFSFIFHG
jgi:hypothetical protein